jgi:acyl-CoA reductase-like NAD-dependent aldehyde dehydrogenase
MADLVCVSPADGREYARRVETPAAMAEAALKRARAAQREWREAPLAERCEAAARFLGAMERLNPAIVPELAWQMGRPIRYGGELRSLKERVEAMIDLAPEALADDVRPNGRVVRVPAGLVMVIAPWNYPYLTAANTIVPALLAGNAVILKHSAQTLLAGERFAEALAAAGLPDGLFANLFLSHQATVDMLGAGLVDHATFTGSVAAGRAVEEAAAGSFTGLTLELGGKDPAYVRADADIGSAVEGIADGAFFNSGQSCCAVERVYVHETVWEPFLDGLVEAAGGYRLGDPLDPDTTLGPMATAKGSTLVRRQVEEAVRAGATAHLAADGGEGTYVAPQVLTGVDHRMALMRDETFGPVVGLMKVADDEEALRLMNDSAYGLAASIWTRDLKAGAALAARVEAGTVLINRCDYLDPFLAWTGVKESGRGASLGRYGFDSVTRPRSLYVRSA